ncbi:MAG: phosphoglycerate dehydrogenase, partial [Pseudomonadota bacterium]|nr:phosphoglycerate dehydrogenase [Pseudomonadota bacterium]
STLEAQENVAIQIAEQMSDYLLEGAVINALNMPSISADEAPTLSPFVKLSEQLGLFAGQLMLSNFNKIEIEYVGDISEFNCAPITSAAVSGVLKPSLPDINMVSAPSIARDKGITISEVKRDESSAYESYIKVSLYSKEDKFSIGGTVFSDENPRIVQINGINLEAELNRNMLYVTNKDVPGLIGHLGSILGDEGINIASFNLGRNAPLKDAMALIGVDSEINSNVISNVKKLDSIVTVNSLVFNIK